jgi:hypothetical protein
MPPMLWLQNWRPLPPGNVTSKVNHDYNSLFLLFCSYGNLALETGRGIRVRYPA